ncbi:Lnb N-terminal periplasmic domain-containing protein [Burkholderia multivorans]|uniref:Lnb N-terminal periplasmic domain-containing protein n=1 Tax=Burkholderia multivorans TaxID=87883 RepID=UPI000CFFB359|nr:DUF4105 domain-containing protein [Burkholderia multivorans]MBU9185952.1 DUF4105 domain-containing protein [Burkholderia multivorans]PRE21509.1 hypothetical protein C6P79_30775 [Burkholderia multivorans]
MDQHDDIEDNSPHCGAATERNRTCMNPLSSLIRFARAPAVWVPEYARAARVEWRGSQIAVRDVRNFRYRTRNDCMPAYYDAEFELDAVTTVDLVVSRWTAEAIAHVFVSFGLDDGRYVAISIETRRRHGQRYSPYLGFLPLYDLVYVVADERDLTGVRSDVRRERVYLFRAQVTAETARALFADYLRRMHSLEGRPEFYNTLLNNCTTNILRHIRAVAPDVGYSWKVLLSGYADQYGHDLGLLDASMAFDALKSASLIRRAPGAVIDDDFSTAIRASLPFAPTHAK